MPRWAEFTGGKKKKKSKKKTMRSPSMNDMMSYNMLNYGSTMGSMGSLGLYPSTCDPCTTLVDPCSVVVDPCTSMSALTYVPYMGLGGGVKKRKKKKSTKKRMSKRRLSGGKHKSVAHKSHKKRKSVAHKKRHSKLKSAVPMKRKSNADKKRLSKGKKRPMNAYFKKMNAARKQGKKSFMYKGKKYVRRRNPNPKLADVYKRAR